MSMTDTPEKVTEATVFKPFPFVGFAAPKGFDRLTAAWSQFQSTHAGGLATAKVPAHWYVATGQLVHLGCLLPGDEPLVFEFDTVTWPQLAEAYTTLGVAGVDLMSVIVFGSTADLAEAIELWGVATFHGRPRRVSSSRW